MASSWRRQKRREGCNGNGLHSQSSRVPVGLTWFSRKGARFGHFKKEPSQREHLDGWNDLSGGEAPGN